VSLFAGISANTLIVANGFAIISNRRVKKKAEGRWQKEREGKRHSR
jgi:hypothetical protein